MTLGPNESSWVGQRAQEMINILEAEYTRPSVMFKPTLKKNSLLWQATHDELSALGANPDEAMRNFDKAWVEKLTG